MNINADRINKQKNKRKLCGRGEKSRRKTQTEEKNQKSNPQPVIKSVAGNENKNERYAHNDYDDATRYDSAKAKKKPNKSFILAFSCLFEHTFECK